MTFSSKLRSDSQTRPRSVEFAQFINCEAKGETTIRLFYGTFLDDYHPDLKEVLFELGIKFRFLCHYPSSFNSRLISLWAARFDPDSEASWRVWALIKVVRPFDHLGVFQFWPRRGVGCPMNCRMHPETLGLPVFKTARISSYVEWRRLGPIIFASSEFDIENSTTR
jgi:hypothetical protein